MKNDLEYAYGSLRVALSGVKFFYSVTCKRPWNIFSMLRLQNIHTLPEVITIEQVHRIIDSARGMVHVHRGKGAKDRYLPLPTSILQMLRAYWSTHRHPRFLFPADGLSSACALSGARWRGNLRLDRSA
jgi:integrase/recombinase XerD